MSALTREAVLQALAQVEDPAFGRSMLELGTLSDVVVEDEVEAVADRTIKEISQ